MYAQNAAAGGAVRHKRLYAATGPNKLVIGAATSAGSGIGVAQARLVPAGAHKRLVNNGLRCLLSAYGHHARNQKNADGSVLMPVPIKWVVNPALSPRPKIRYEIRQKIAAASAPRAIESETAIRKRPLMASAQSASCDARTRLVFLRNTSKYSPFHSGSKAFKALLSKGLFGTPLQGEWIPIGTSTSVALSS